MGPLPKKQILKKKVGLYQIKLKKSLKKRVVSREIFDYLKKQKLNAVILREA